MKHPHNTEKSGMHRVESKSMKANEILKELKTNKNFLKPKNK